MRFGNTTKKLAKRMHRLLRLQVRQHPTLPGCIQAGQSYLKPSWLCIGRLFRRICEAIKVVCTLGRVFPWSQLRPFLIEVLNRQDGSIGFAHTEHLMQGQVSQDGDGMKPLMCLMIAMMLEDGNGNVTGKQGW